MKIIWHWLTLTIAIIATKYLLPGAFTLNPLYVVFVLSACLMFVNLIIKPIINILTLPINILTLGIFGVVLNGAILWFFSYVVPGFRISSFADAVIVALIISVLNWILEKIF